MSRYQCAVSDDSLKRDVAALSSVSLKLNNMNIVYILLDEPLPGVQMWTETIPKACDVITQATCMLASRVLMILPLSCRTILTLSHRQKRLQRRAANQN